MSLQSVRKEAREMGVEIGKLTTEKDSQGEYTIYEDGREVGCTSFAQNANEAKESYISDKLNGYFD